jgi:hypothetical protein
MQGSGLFLPYHAEEVGPVVGDIDPTVTAQNQGGAVRPTIRSGAYLSIGVTRCVVLRVLGRGYRAFSARIGAGLRSIMDTNFREVIF